MRVGLGSWPVGVMWQISALLGSHYLGGGEGLVGVMGIVQEAQRFLTPLDLLPHEESPQLLDIRHSLRCKDEVRHRRVVTHVQDMGMLPACALIAAAR